MRFKYFKEIKNNLLSLGTIELLGLLIPIITMPILTRSLGGELYGQYLLIITIILFSNTIIDYGCQFVGTKDVSKNLHKKNILSYYFSAYQIIRLILLIIYLVVIIILSEIMFSTEIKHYIIFGVIPYTIGYYLLAPWFLIAIGQSKLLLITSLISRIINFIIIIFFIKKPNDFGLLVYSYVIPILINGIFIHYFILKVIKIKFFILNFKSILTYFKKSNGVFIGILAPNLYNSIPAIVLGGHSDPIDYARYMIASRICGIVFTFQNVISTSIYPILTRLKGNYVKKLIKINLLIAIPSTLIIIIFGETILSVIIGKELSQNNFYLKVISISIIAIAISNALSKGYFLVKGMTNIYTRVTIRVSIISALINLLLIYQWGVLGAAIGLTIARLLLSIDYSYSYITSNSKFSKR